MIRCPSCSQIIPWRKFKPHFKDSGAIILRNRPLCCYQVKCGCGMSGDYNKDYVRDEWIKDNPTKKVVPLLS